MGLLAITYFFIYILLFDLFSMYYIYIFKYCNNTDDVPFGDAGRSSLQPNQMSWEADCLLGLGVGIGRSPRAHLFFIFR